MILESEQGVKGVGTMGNFICIDVGGTSIKYGLATKDGSFISKGNILTEAKKDGGYGILDKIKKIVNSFINGNEVLGICISTAGMVDPNKGEIVFSLEELIPNYTGMKLKEEIENEFNIKCHVENDVNCAGLGEAWLGAGKEKSSVVCLTIGTGIGGCIILNGKLFHGFSNCAGEVGYMNINGESFQRQASTTTLVENVAKAKGIDKCLINGETIFKLAKENDEDAIKEIDSLVNILAIGIGNICYMINPEVIILGGGIMSQQEYLRPRLDRALKENLIERVYLSTKLEFAKLQNDAGMLGALYNFLDREKI